MLRPLASLLLLGTLAMPLAGCGDNPLVSPSPPQAQVLLDIFTGEVSAGATTFYSFTIATPGTTRVTYASLIDIATGRALDAEMEVGIGIPAGTGCHVTTAVTASPGLSAHVLQPMTAGVYCIQLRAVGQIPGPATFAVRIAHT